MEKVLITGITGQDGAYLAKNLIEKGYDVYGAVRRGSTPKKGRLEFLNILDKVTYVPLELTEYSNVHRTLANLKPKYIYNLAAQSFVQDSFIHPLLTSAINFDGVQNILEAINLTGLDCKMYQASTSEMYGDVLSDPQDENTPFNPLSPYAVSKCAAHHIVRNYRVAYGMNCSNGILFNHESEMRGREFVTRKISSQMAELSKGRDHPIQLGNFNSVRDWGYAPDFVEAMELIINSNEPDDFVVATNTIHSVREFFEISASIAGFNPIFEGSDINEKCVDKNTGKILCEVNKEFFRPSDVVYLRGDYTKINTKLGWKPKTSFSNLVEAMTKHDIDAANGKINAYGI
jgi:GDPmannose 4,6-dehydratase